MSADFFDAMYSQADGDDQHIPWQHALSRELIGEWLRTLDPSNHRRAIVVAAGLGDDAAALAGHGLDVVAFDQAPTAVQWARERHPEVSVDWQVADLFAPPPPWRGAFDLVIEVFTVQSIEPADQMAAADAVRSLLAPGGTLVAVALVHDGSAEPDGPPWPLHPATLERLAHGLEVAATRRDEVGAGVTAVRLELRSPRPETDRADIRRPRGPARPAR